MNENSAASPLFEKKSIQKNVMLMIYPVYFRVQNLQYVLQWAIYLQRVSYSYQMMATAGWLFKGTHRLIGTLSYCLIDLK